MIVIDVEATGLDVFSTSILSIAAVEFENHQNRFYKECRIWEGAFVSDHDIKYSGFSKESLNNETKPYPKDIVLDLIEWMKPIPNKVLAGHVIHHDYFWIDQEIKRSKIDYKISFRHMDLHSLTYALHLKNNMSVALNDLGDSKLSLDNSAKFYGLNSFNRKNKHNSMEDCLAATECINRALYGKNLIEEFKNDPVPDYILNNYLTK